MEAPSRPPPPQQSSAKNIRNGPTGFGPLWRLMSRTNPTEGTAGPNPPKLPPTSPHTQVPRPASSSWEIFLRSQTKARPQDDFATDSSFGPPSFKTPLSPAPSTPAEEPLRIAVASDPLLRFPLRSPFLPAYDLRPDVPRYASNLPNRGSIPLSRNFARPSEKRRRRIPAA